MSVLQREVRSLSFHIEVMNSRAAENYYSWEVRHYGQASDTIKRLRHYWLKRLLERQLREFDRG